MITMGEGDIHPGCVCVRLYALVKSGYVIAAEVQQQVVLNSDI